MSAGLAAAAADLAAAGEAWRAAVFGPRVPPDWRGPAADAARRSATALLDRGGLLADRLRRVAAVAADVAGRGVLSPADDARLAAVIAGSLAVAPPGAVSASAAPATGDGPTPAAVAHWWRGLTPDERDRLLVERPELVGGLDGVPAAARDRANRARLGAARHAAEVEQAALLAVRGGEMDRREAGRRLAEVRARLRRLAAIDAAVAAPDRALLALDPGAERAAVAHGDVDRARAVGVFVPGFTAGAADLPARTAELAAVARRAGPGAAVVAWYDYPAPQWDEVLTPRRSVLAGDTAAATRHRLASFLGGLDAAPVAGPPRVTAVGHSYGSVTVAHALPAAPGVDATVLLGSPGVPATATAGREVWVAEARGDAVADLGWFGPDANRVAEHHGLSTADAPARLAPSGAALPATTASHGHGEYLTPGSTSAENVAAVVAGRTEDVSPDRTIGAGDRLRGLFRSGPLLVPTPG